MSLKAWARYKRPEDMTTDIILALVLLALAVPLLMSLNNKGIATLAPSSSPSHDPKAAKPVQALRQAIIGQESNGQCSIQNKSGSGAAGLAQVMPENVSAWSREALGRSVSVSEFLKDCRLQLQVIDHKIAQYWQQEQGDLAKPKRCDGWQVAGMQGNHPCMTMPPHNTGMATSILASATTRFLS